MRGQRARVGRAGFRRCQYESPVARWYAAGVKRVLLTGMSGTGKSTVIAMLAARGYKAIDTDYGDWHEWVDVDGEPDWVWREDRMRELLSTEDADVLFVSGTASNQGKFYPQFDDVVLLSAPTAVILERLVSRTNNPYGKHPDELARILGHIETVEPLLRRSATIEIDTSVPLGEVVETILRLVQPTRHVHRTTPDEWRAYKELRLRALRDEPQAFGEPYQHAAALPDARWRRRLEEAGGPMGGELLFAQRGGQLV